MIVSALVVTLSQDPASRTAAITALASDPRLTVGTPVRDRLPVVAETETSAHGASLCEELGAREGVVRVDVVTIDFSLEQT